MNKKINLFLILFSMHKFNITTYFFFFMQIISKSNLKKELKEKILIFKFKFYLNNLQKIEIKATFHI
jgi:hypothetical protein